MPLTNLIATNEDAEKLFKYILAYRNRMGAACSVSMQNTPLKDYVSMGVIMPEETLTVSAETRRHSSRQ